MYYNHQNGYRHGPVPPRVRPGAGWSIGSLLRDLVTTWRLIWDPKVPGLLKICFPFLALLYFIWPLDLMPGLPFDDIAIMLLAARMFVRLAPQDRVHKAYPGGAGPTTYYDFRNGRHQNGRPTGNDDHDVIDTTWRVLDDDK
jgi:hypothetical protein